MLVMIVKHSYVFLKPFSFICARQRSGASVREIVNVSVGSVYVCHRRNLGRPLVQHYQNRQS
jgi:hypothetical protein